MIQLFFRVLQHLLPHSEAWRLAAGTTIRKLFEGLIKAFADAVAYVDLVWLDLFPKTTRQVAEFEKQFGLESNGSDTARRQRLAAEWAATGGQSPGYIEGVLQTAGFDVYVHECWESGPPWVARDPRLYTQSPKVGTWRCGSVARSNPSYADGPTCSTFSTRARCNRFLNNDPHYIVNLDLTQQAPPPIPDDETKWPYFFYVGAATFGSYAIVDASRRGEFERLLLKLRPVHLWIVTLINYVSGDESFILTEDFDPITTEDTDEPLLVE